MTQDCTAVCTQCKQTLPLADFYGLQSRCIPCEEARRFRRKATKPMARICPECRQEVPFKSGRGRCATCAQHRRKAATTACTQNKRAERVGAPGRLTAQQVVWIYEYYDHKCKDCGATEKLTLDHVKPLSYGGSNWPANLQVVCQWCNHHRFNRLEFARYLEGLPPEAR